MLHNHLSVLDFLFAMACEPWHKCHSIVHCRAKQSPYTGNAASLDFFNYQLSSLCPRVTKVEVNGQIRLWLCLTRWTIAVSFSPPGDIDLFYLGY